MSFLAGVQKIVGNCFLVSLIIAGMVDRAIANGFSIESFEMLKPVEEKQYDGLSHSCKNNIDLAKGTHLFFMREQKSKIVTSPFPSPFPPQNQK